ncbi:prepilin peptidase [Streptomyces glomeratus]|uniref:Prepilin type IV endopeptidase peptidase domain-containing protein n=1 Tax=Streptomyces glomeratus TaxID=284452 RepID=A0ABP6M4Y2_9ACTN|nr:A24 family peptidase [Streptomyces glomeratus]MCF1512516.1 A24 family peptidase [Streptomyces glomeratus]
MLPDADGSWTPALLGPLILGACYLVLFLITKGFGFGDVKLALVLGAVLGWYCCAIVLVDHHRAEPDPTGVDNPPLGRTPESPARTPRPSARPLR